MRRARLAADIGGMGARPTKDGLSSTAFPSGVGAIQVEITEAQSPLIFRRREFAKGSGGADGRVGRVALASGRVLPGKETYVVPAGDCLIAEMPGGGDYGRK